MQSLRLLSASSASAAPVRVVLGRALFHTSAAPAGSFPSNQAKRRARRKFLQSQARKYDIKPTMSNDMIVRYLQDKGAPPPPLALAPPSPPQSGSLSH